MRVTDSMHDLCVCGEAGKRHKVSLEGQAHCLASIQKCIQNAYKNAYKNAQTKIWWWQEDKGTNLLQTLISTFSVEWQGVADL